jgi:rhodanese-related sulfurtransferase
MRKPIKTALLAIAIPMIGASSTTVHAEEPPCPFDESRSGLCGYYKSQISPAEAFLNAVVRQGRWSRPSERAVILDVRSTPEYKAGYPEGAYNVPYPFIYQYCENNARTPDGACAPRTGGDQIRQTNEAFVNYVQAIIPNKDTPIYTLCRTGVRSVAASNLLTDAGYTHVRNIWEGFVGINLKAPKIVGYELDGNGEPDLKKPITEMLSVDLNHDGVLDERDLNGWRYHYGLPYVTRLLPQLIYKDMAYLYNWD